MCDDSRLSIGSVLSNGGEFDIDDLQIFSEILTSEELKSKMLGESRTKYVVNSICIKYQ